MELVRFIVLFLIVCNNFYRLSALPGIHENNDADTSPEDATAQYDRQSPLSPLSADYADLNEIAEDDQLKQYEVPTGWTYKCDIDGQCEIIMRRRRSFSPDLFPEKESENPMQSAPEINANDVFKNNTTEIMKAFSHEANQSDLLDLLRMSKLKPLTQLRLGQALKNKADSLEHGDRRTVPQKPSPLNFLKETDEDPKLEQDNADDDDGDEDASFLELMSVAAKRAKSAS